MNKLKSFRLGLAAVLASLARGSARRAMTRDVLGASLALRNRWVQGIIDEAGANALLELWNGTRPATGGTPTGTKLATLTGGSVIGTASAGLLDFSESNFTQVAGNHVNGTPTWFRIRKSDTTHVVDGSLGGVDGAFSGNVVTGTAVTFNPSTVTAPNA
jgi:hypothetical protein